MVNPRAAVGFDRNLPIVALDQEALTYVACCGSQAALVSTDVLIGTQGRTTKMRFFSPIKANTIALTVTALAFHKKRKFLALCIAQLHHHGPAIVIYNLAKFNKHWVPTVLEAITWEPIGSKAEFKQAAFSADASIILAVTKHPVMAIGFDWQHKTLVFSTNLFAPGTNVKNVCFHPWDPFELSTSGPGHIQLWRILHKELKPRQHVSYLSCVGANFTTHEWLDSELLVAGTGSGDIIIIWHNEQTQRFAGVHSAAIRGIVPLNHGFATVCSASGLCLFQHGAESRMKKKGRHYVRLTRRITLDGTWVIRSVSTFPGPNGPMTLFVCKHAVAVFDITQLLLKITQKARQFRARQLGAHHSYDILTMSAAATKSLLVSCSVLTNVVYVWDWKSSDLVLRHVGDETFQKQSLVSLDMHPRGLQLLAGFEDEIHLYDVGRQSLLIVERIAAKGVVSLKRDHSPLVSTAPLSLLKYAHGGHLFAATMGRLVLVYETISPESARLGLIHALQGHASNVTGLVWGVEDQRLFTFSEDGAIYEWSVGAFENRGKILTRTRDCVRLGIEWNSVGMFGDGTLVAAGIPCEMSQREGTTRPIESFLCVWSGAIDLASFDIPAGNTVIACLLPVESKGDCHSVLVAGTTRGSMLIFPWSFIDAMDDTRRFREVPLCDSPIVALTHSCYDDTICAACRGGMILICDANRTDCVKKIEVPDNMVSIECNTLTKLEAKLYLLETQLRQEKNNARQLKDETRPEYERLLLLQQGQSSAEIERLQIGSRMLEKKNESVRITHAAAIKSMKVAYEIDMQEFEFAYEKKLATEAARYTEVKDEIDNLRLDARNQRKQYLSDIIKVERKWKTSIADSNNKFMREIRLLRDGIFQGKCWTFDLLEDQQKRSGLEYFRLRENLHSEISNLRKKLTKSYHERAELKRKAEQLNMDYHKNRDELTESQQSCHAVVARANVAEGNLLNLITKLKAESEIKDQLAYTVDLQQRRIEDLHRWKGIITKQKEDLKSKLSDSEESLAAQEKQGERIGLILEGVSHRNKSMVMALHRKANELQRTKKHIGDCRQRCFSRDKKMCVLVEQIDVSLSQLRSASLPKSTTLFEIDKIGDIVAQMHPQRHHNASRPEYEAGGNFPANPAPRLPIKKVFKRSQEEHTICQLRRENAELMNQLNELRFDRKSLRRKIGQAANLRNGQ